MFLIYIYYNYFINIYKILLIELYYYMYYYNKKNT